MNWLLTIILVSAIFSWVLTLKYQDELAELKASKAEELADSEMSNFLAIKEYSAEISRLEAENAKLRGMLK